MLFHSATEESRSMHSTAGRKPAEPGRPDEQNAVQPDGFDREHDIRAPPFRRHSALGSRAEPEREKKNLQNGLGWAGRRLLLPPSDPVLPPPGPPPSATSPPARPHSAEALFLVNALPPHPLLPAPAWGGDRCLRFLVSDPLLPGRIVCSRGL